jgi:hypothetical protein
LEYVIKVNTPKMKKLNIRRLVTIIKARFKRVNTGSFIPFSSWNSTLVKS